MKYKVYSVGDYVPEEFEVEKKLPFEQLQKLVGIPGEQGFVTVAPHLNGTGGFGAKRHGGWTMLVDEDGLPKRMPLNKAASEVMGYDIVGDAVEIDWPLS